MTELTPVRLPRTQSLAKRIRVPMGFITAAIYLWFARPTALALLLSLALTFPGLWLRAYAAGYVRKNAELTTTGPYAYVRNPLYLGSLLITLGFGFASSRVPLLLLLAAVFLAIYLPTIQGEQTYLRAHFSSFPAYAAQVPALIPRLTPAPSLSGAGSFSRERYLHHREYNSAMGAAAIYAVLLLRPVLTHLHHFLIGPASPR